MSNIAPLKPREDDALSLRSPPHNFEAEVQLLGAILANNRAFERVGDFLLAEHFMDDRHRRIYEACGKMINRGQMASATTLKNYFEQDATLTEIGGVQYLYKLAGSAMTVINATEHGRIVHDLFLRRQLINLGEDVVNKAYAHDLESGAREQIEAAEQQLFNLATTGENEGTLKPLRLAINTAIDMAEIAFKRESHITGATTGLEALDKKLGGLHKSDLLVLAGRPSMGKTALATKMAFKAAEAYRERTLEDGTVEVAEGAKVAFFSLEMSAEQLANRLLAELTEVPSDKIRRGEVRPDDFPRFVEASQRLANIPMFIDDTPALSVSALRTRARRLQRTHGLGLIVIDYLQLLAPSPGARSENRVQEISAITRGLKALAKELNVPVLALSQLSRAVEQREDKRPQLSDLRESGTIEQDADVVMFVYREAYYLQREEPARRAEEGDEKFHDRYEKWQQRATEMHNIAEVIIGKQRHGPIGTVKVLFEGMFTKFDNLPEGAAPADDDRE